MEGFGFHMEVVMVRQELISVIMPTYNRGNVIEKAIMSITQQTYKAWELIIIDDGSVDDTPNIVKKYEREYENIFYIRKETNSGVSAARNLGLKQAKGQFIAFLDSDDRWESDFLDSCYRLMNQYNTDIVFESWKYQLENEEYRDVDSKTYEQLEKIAENVSNGVYWVSGKKCISFSVLNSLNFFHVNALLMRKEIAVLFPVELKISEDMAFIYFSILRSEKNIVISTSKNYIYTQNEDSVYNYFDRSKTAGMDGISEARLARKICTTLLESAKAYLYIHKRISVEDVSKSVLDKFKWMAFNKMYTVYSLSKRFNLDINFSDFRKLSYQFCFWLLIKRVVNIKQNDFGIDIY